MARKCRDLFSRSENEKIPRGASKDKRFPGGLRDPPKDANQELKARVQQAKAKAEKT